MDYSPLLAWITAALEIGLVCYLLITQKPKSGATLVLLGILLLLAGYQILEALNCSAAFEGRFSRAAFVDITWLPPMGLLYIAIVMRRRLYGFIAGLYIAAACAFTIWYGFFDSSVMLSHCDTVIAVYLSPQPYRAMYGVFYQSGIGLLMLLPLFRKGLNLAPATRRSLTLFQLGVLGFMLPSLTTALIFTALRRALPSVMCHYALILALFIGILLILEKRDEG